MIGSGVMRWRGGLLGILVLSLETSVLAPSTGTSVIYKLCCVIFHYYLGVLFVLVIRVKFNLSVRKLL